MKRMQPLNTRLDDQTQEQIEQLIADALSGINTGDKSGVVIRRLELGSEGGVEMAGASLVSAIEAHVLPERGVFSIVLRTDVTESYLTANAVKNSYANGQYVFYLDELGGGYTRLGHAIVQIVSAYLDLPSARENGYTDVDAVFGARLMPRLAASKIDGCFTTAVTADSSLQQLYKSPWSHQTREQDMPIQRVPVQLPNMSVE